MPTPLTKLGKALEGNRILAGLSKSDVATRMGTTSRGLWDRVITAARPTVESIQRAAAAVGHDQADALRLAGYDPDLVTRTRATRQQPEQQQQSERLAG